MRKLFEHLTILSMIILIAYIILMPRLPYNETKKSCVIDSVVVTNKYSFMPELVHRYHTECGYWFTSNKEYTKGDTVEYSERRYYKGD